MVVIVEKHVKIMTVWMEEWLSALIRFIIYVRNLIMSFV
jgi:hypothetical protein